MAPRIGSGVNGAIIALYSPAGCHSLLSFAFHGNPGPGLPSAFAAATAAFQSFNCFSRRTFTTELLSVIFAHSRKTGISPASSDRARRLAHASAGVPPH